MRIKLAPSPLSKPEPWNFLNVGLIQTSLDGKSAWQNGPPMAPLEQTLAWEEIQRCLRAFRSCEPRPHLVLIPELSVPRSHLTDLRRAAGALGSVVVAGVDYRLDIPNREAFNEAVVFVPRRWKTAAQSSQVTELHIGKTYPAAEEARLLSKKNWTFRNEANFWVFDGGEAGRFGVSICYDFLDLERALMYKEQVQHLFVVAYNRDADSFMHMAESLARAVYCNVVICNTGHYGGSLAISPYYEPYARTVYRHNGNEMLTSQVIRLPVKSLIEAQEGRAPERRWKSLPPGWSKRAGGKVKISLTKRGL